MYDIFKCLLGRRFCPWCLAYRNGGRRTLWERLVVNHYPNWMIIARYDHLVGTIGLKWHGKHH